MSVLDEFYVLQQEVILNDIEEDEKAQKEKKLEKYANSLYRACYDKAKFEKLFYSKNDALSYLVKLINEQCIQDYSKKQGIKQICEYIKGRICEIDWYIDLNKMRMNPYEIAELRNKICKEFGEDVFKSLFYNAQNRAVKMIEENDEIETIFIFTPRDEKFLKETWESYLKEVEEVKKAFSDD